MNIGEFKNVNGRLRGMIATADIHLPRLALRPVQNDHPRAPRFEIVTLNAGNVWVYLGALWEATATKSGESFLQGNIDQPNWPASIAVALFGNDEEGYRVAWRREQPRDFAPNNAAASDDFDGPGMGGFGESTAGLSGTMPADPVVDDEVPY